MAVIRFNKEGYVEIPSKDADISAEVCSYVKGYETFLICDKTDDDTTIHAEVHRDYADNDNIDWEHDSSSFLKINDKFIYLERTDNKNQLSIKKSNDINYTAITTLKIEYGKEVQLEDIIYFAANKSAYKVFDIKEAYTDYGKSYKHDFYARLETRRDKYELVVNQYKYKLRFAEDALYVDVCERSKKGDK